MSHLGSLTPICFVQLATVLSHVTGPPSCACRFPQQPQQLTDAGATTTSTLQPPHNEQPSQHCTFHQQQQTSPAVQQPQMHDASASAGGDSSSNSHAVRHQKHMRGSGGGYGGSAAPRHPVVGSQGLAQALAGGYSKLALELDRFVAGLDV